MFVLPMYLFPLPWGLGVDTYAGRRLLQILWAGGLLLALLRLQIRLASARLWIGLSLPSRLAACAFIGGALLSALLSSAPLYAVRQWSLITLLLVAALPLSAVLPPRMKMLEVTGLTLVLYAILVGTTPFEHGFIHPRFQGQALAVVGPAVLFSGNLTLALMGAPALALGILNGSRALALTLLVSVVAAGVLWPERRKRLTPGLISLLVTLMVVGVYLALGFDSSVEAAVERGTSSTGRIGIWIETLTRWAGAPLLGVGPGMLARVPGLGGWASHPHNSVLLVAAETGIIGLGSMAVLVARGVRRITHLTADRRPWALALIGGGFHSLFSGTTVMPASQALLVLALALVLPEQRDLPEGREGVRVWIPPLLGALALVCLLATLFLPGADGTAGGQGPRFFQGGIP